eukprot:3055967-Pyramimonas_sp.AAC.1
MAIDVPTKVSATKIEELPTSMLSPLDVCQFFYDSEHPPFQDVGMRDDPNWMDIYIPIILHGD